MLDKRDQESCIDSIYANKCLCVDMCIYAQRAREIKRKRERERESPLYFRHVV